MKKSLRFVIAFLIAVSVMANTSIAKPKKVEAVVVSVELRLIPFRTWKIDSKTGKKVVDADYPATQNRITLDRALTGNSNSTAWANGSTRFYTIDIPPTGAIRGVTVSAKYSNGARLDYNYNVWISPWGQYIYLPSNY